MTEDNPEARRQRLKELRKKASSTEESNVPRKWALGGREDKPASGSKVAFAKRHQDRGRLGDATGNGGRGEGKLMEKFPKLREALAKRSQEAGGGENRQLLRELIKQRRTGVSQGSQTAASVNIDQQISNLEERVNKMQSRLDAAVAHLESLREQKAKAES